MHSHKIAYPHTHTHPHIPTCTRSNDLFLALVLGTTIITTLTRWDEYATCEYPLQLYLVMSYAFVIAFRCCHFVKQYHRGNPLYTQRTRYGGLTACVCIYVCMYAHMCVCAYIGKYVSMYI